MDKKVLKVRVQTRQLSILIDQRIVVIMDSWPVNSMYPVGHYVQTLGKIGDKEAETKALLLTYDIPSDGGYTKMLTS